MLSCVYVRWVVTRILFEQEVSPNKSLRGILLVSLRGIMECDSRTFYSSSAPSFHPSSSLPCLSLFLPPVFSPSPTISRPPEGGLSTLWLVLLAAVQSRRMPAWLSMSCLMKMDQHITLGKAVFFFYLIKKTTFDENRNIVRTRRDSCWVIHLLTVFYMKACSRAACF